MGVRFHIERLVDDFGGAANLAELLGKPRTTPYRWMRTGAMVTTNLCSIVDAAQRAGLEDFDLNRYFERQDDGGAPAA